MDVDTHALGQTAHCWVLRKQPHHPSYTHACVCVGGGGGVFLWLVALATHIASLLGAGSLTRLGLGAWFLGVVVWWVVVGWLVCGLRVG
jgi:hypothetical protein